MAAIREQETTELDIIQLQVLTAVIAPSKFLMIHILLHPEEARGIQEIIVMKDIILALEMSVEIAAGIDIKIEYSLPVMKIGGEYPFILLLVMDLIKIRKFRKHLYRKLIHLFKTTSSAFIDK